MDGENTDVVCSEAPDRKSTAQRCDTGVDSFEHTVSSEGILLLAGCLLLHVSDARRNVVLFDGIAAGLAELEFFLELLALVV